MCIQNCLGGGGKGLPNCFCFFNQELAWALAIWPYWGWGVLTSSQQSAERQIQLSIKKMTGKMAGSQPYCWDLSQTWGGAVLSANPGSQENKIYFCDPRERYGQKTLSILLFSTPSFLQYSILNMVQYYTTVILTHKWAKLNYIKS